MAVTLTTVHYVYIVLMAVVILTMVMKKDTTISCILGILVLGVFTTHSFASAVNGIFNSFVFAMNELAGTILIISIITGLCKILEVTGINEVMVSPLTRLIKTPNSAFWIIGLVMFLISSFFWPSPAVALIGAVFLPVALRVKLPAMGAAMAMNLFGHGIALSGDFIIKGAPKIAADSAGLPVDQLIAASVPLVVIMGATTTISAFIFLKRDMKRHRFDCDQVRSTEEQIADAGMLLPPGQRKLFAVLVPLVFLVALVVMFLLKLTGGDASALIGGTALLLLVAVAFAAYRSNSFEQVGKNLVKGFKFGFSVFGTVIPVAAFFFLGGSGFAAVFGEALSADSGGLVNDIGIALSNVMPSSDVFSTITLSSIGVVTGLDGSGFSGLTLVGSVAKLFGAAANQNVSVLTALGQVVTIWVGGGTVIPWAVIPVAAICKVSPVELAAKNLKPVFIGLVVTTIAAVFLV